MQTVSRFIAEQPQPQVLSSKARKLMLLVRGFVGGSFVVFAPWIAEMRNNPSLVNGYRAAGIILFGYAIYTVYIGVLNGRKHFFKQALFDITFTNQGQSCPRSGFGWAGHARGVLWFRLGAVIIMVLAVWKVGPNLRDGQMPAGLYGYAAQVMHQRTPLCLT